MSEKMLVTQALDERDLLAKKINGKIEKALFVDTKKVNEEKTFDSRITVDEFTQTAESALQQIMDLIDRYMRLDAAIVASNASTFLETSRGKMSVAGAIALRNRLKGDGLYFEEGCFEGKVTEQIKEQYKNAVQAATQKNSTVENQAENMRLSILGRDGRNKDQKPLEVVDAFIRENTTEVIDPLGAEKKIQEMKEKIESTIQELTTLIKVSNATTTIEF